MGLALVVAPGVAVGFPEPPVMALISHHSKRASTTTATTTARRRFQYTLGGSSPTGCVSPLIGASFGLFNGRAPRAGTMEKCPASRQMMPLCLPCSIGTPSRAEIFRGVTAARIRGAYSSARSCSSRRPWLALNPCGESGWSVGPPPLPLRRQARPTPCAPGGAWVTRGGRRVCGSARGCSSRGTAVWCPWT